MSSETGTRGPLAQLAFLILMMSSLASPVSAETCDQLIEQGFEAFEQVDPLKASYHLSDEEKDARKEVRGLSERAVEQCPERARAWYLRAIAHQPDSFSGSAEEAVDALQKAVELKPSIEFDDRGAMLLAHIVLYMPMQRPDVSRRWCCGPCAPCGPEDFTPVGYEEKDDAPTGFQRAEESGKPQMATQAYLGWALPNWDFAVRHWPESQFPEYVAGLLLLDPELVRPGEAISYLEPVVQQCGTDSRTLTLLTQAYLQNEQTEEAARVAEELEHVMEIKEPDCPFHGFQAAFRGTGTMGLPGLVIHTTYSRFTVAEAFIEHGETERAIPHLDVVIDYYETRHSPGGSTLDDFGPRQFKFYEAYDVKTEAQRELGRSQEANSTVARKWLARMLAEEFSQFHSSDYKFSGKLTDGQFPFYQEGRQVEMTVSEMADHLTNEYPDNPWAWLFKGVSQCHGVSEETGSGGSIRELKRWDCSAGQRAFNKVFELDPDFEFPDLFSGAGQLEAKKEFREEISRRLELARNESE